MKPTLLAIIGKPLVGKDTQADLFVAEHKDAAKISTGEILRAVHKEGESHRFWSLIGPYIPMMESGLKLPDTPTLSMLEQVMVEQLRDGKSFVIIAGSPRGLVQLEGFEAMAKKEGAQLLIAHMDATDEETRLRSKTRNEGRIDDAPIVHEVRLDEYRKYVLPVVEKLRQEGTLIELDGMKPIETVFAELEREVNRRIVDPEITLPAMARR